MKWFDRWLRYLVGVFFIFSGLVKLDDPVGTGIKMKEYFEVFTNSIAGFFYLFIPYGLSIGFTVILLEIMLGVALLLNYRMLLTSWLLLLLILFFTFLTFFSAYFNKVTDCGCFGDAISLTPWQSFSKDVVLLTLIVILFMRRKYSRPVKVHWSIPELIMAGSFLIFIFLGLYAINHLPFIDFMPYRLGHNIPLLMKPSAPFRYKYVFEKDGTQFSFSEYPSDTTYSIKKMILLNPGAQPKITDYHVWNDQGDFTNETFTGNKLFVIMYDVSRADLHHLGELNQLLADIRKQNQADSLLGKTSQKVEMWILTSSNKNEIEDFRNKYHINIPYYYSDMTVLEAIVRSNPGLWLLKDGTVRGKWHYNDIPSASMIADLVK